MNQPQVYTYSLPFEPPPSRSPSHLSGWIQSPCFADEWIEQLWHIHTAEYYSATKTNTLGSVPLRWMTPPFLLAAHPTPVGLDLRGGAARSYKTSGGGSGSGRALGQGDPEAGGCVCAPSPPRGDLPTGVPRWPSARCTPARPHPVSHGLCWRLGLGTHGPCL